MLGWHLHLRWYFLFPCHLWCDCVNKKGGWSRRPEGWSSSQGGCVRPLWGRGEGSAKNIQAGRDSFCRGQSWSWMGQCSSVQTFYSLCQNHDPPGPTLKTRFRPDCAELSQFCVVAPRSWYKWCWLSAVFGKGKNKRLFFSCSPSSSILPSILQMALLFKRLYSCHTVWNHTLVWPASSFWYSWPSWGFSTLTQALDNDFLVWLFRIKHPVYEYILHVGNVWESTWSIFFTYTWVWWHCLWTRGWERHRPIRMETGRRKVILPLSLGDRLRVTLALKA